MVALWCGKLNLALARQSGSRWFSSRGALAHYHHSLTSNGSTKISTQIEQHVTGRKRTQNPIVRRYITVSSSVCQDITIGTFDWFCNQGKSREAIEVLDYLQNNGYAMDLIRLLRLAKLCGEPETLEEAKAVHHCIVSLVYPSHVSSRNAIIEMYSGCGSVDDSLKVFDEMPEKNLKTWCVMMMCFVKNGYGQEAVDLFTRFKEEGNKPDGEIFKEVFSACALTGDVNEGSLHFEAMQRDYGIIPTMEHYHNVIKMLATSGHLDEALNFVEKMQMEPSVDVWETLMNFSRVHGNLELGDRCAELVQKLDATRLDKMSSAGLVATKEEPKNRSKQRYKDTSHPEMDAIYETLKSLQSQMMETGYVPDIRELAYRNEQVEKRNKEEPIFGYKEEVSVVKGLLSSRPRSSFTVITNFRICKDCHNALKLMSEITGRELIKRDAKRFHHFNKGICSCNDLW